MQDVEILSWLVGSSTTIYFSCLFVAKPYLLRKFGAWIGSRIIALGFAVEAFKDSFQGDKVRVFRNLKDEYDKELTGSWIQRN